jgi:hypothetical protein
MMSARESYGSLRCDLWEIIFYGFGKDIKIAFLCDWQVMVDLLGEPLPTLDSLTNNLTMVFCSEPHYASQFIR